MSSFAYMYIYICIYVNLVCVCVYIYIHYVYIYRYAQINDVSVKGGPHKRQWSIIIQYNIILLNVVLQLPTIFRTVTCCTGL